MTITLTREEAQQVLDALTRVRWAAGERDKKNRVRDFDAAMDVSIEAIETLRARLSAPEQEPVAGYRWEEGRIPPSVTFAAPPQRVYCSCGDGIVPDDGALCGICVSLKKMREWQGLTDEEAIDIEQWSPDVRWAIIRTDAKLKEKNT